MGRYLRSDLLIGGDIQATELGTPQGSPLSPLLAKVLLDDLDKELEKRGHRFSRYMDDVVILFRSPLAWGGSIQLTQSAVGIIGSVGSKQINH